MLVVATLTLASACSKGADQRRNVAATAVMAGANANPVDTGMA